MSDGLNRVLLLGNLGGEPELRFTQAGQAVLSLRLATNESWFDKEANERKERTEWHTVVVWGKRGEALAKILRKGSSIFVEGSIRTSQYDDKEGVKRYKVEIVAADVLLTGSKAEAASGDPKPANGGSGYASRGARTTPAAKATPAAPTYTADPEDLPF